MSVWLWRGLDASSMQQGYLKFSGLSWMMLFTARIRWKSDKIHRGAQTCQKLTRHLFFQQSFRQIRVLKKQHEEQAVFHSEQLCPNRGPHAALFRYRCGVNAGLDYREVLRTCAKIFVCSIVGWEVAYIQTTCTFLDNLKFDMLVQVTLSATSTQKFLQVFWFLILFHWY